MPTAQPNTLTQGRRVALLPEFCGHQPAQAVVWYFAVVVG